MIPRFLLRREWLLTLGAIGIVAGLRLVPLGVRGPPNASTAPAWPWSRSACPPPSTPAASSPWSAGPPTWSPPRRWRSSASTCTPPATAVATAFWWLTATSGLALAAAVVLRRIERRAGRTSHAAARG